MLNFTVGPVMSSPDVIEVASHSTPYFRTPEFSEIMKDNERMMLDLLHKMFMRSSAEGRKICIT